MMHLGHVTYMQQHDKQSQDHTHLKCRATSFFQS